MVWKMKRKMWNVFTSLVFLIPACFATNFTDLGSLLTCEMPSLTFCADVVNYKVPSSIARQAATIEYNLETSSNVLSGNEPECSEVARRVFCKQVFPACSEEKNTVSFEADSGCQTQLQAECNLETYQSLSVSVVCSARTFDLSQACRSLKDLNATSSQRLRDCDIQSPATSIKNLQLSDWMFHHMVVIGVIVDSDNLRMYFPQCYEMHWLYLCYYGECSGGRVRTRANREECLATSSCYPGDFPLTLPCENLPYSAPTFPTLPTVIWPKFVARTFHWSSSPRSSNSNYALFISSLLAALWLIS